MFFSTESLALFYFSLSLGVPRKLLRAMLDKIPMDQVIKLDELVPASDDIRDNGFAWLRSAIVLSEISRVPRETQMRSVVQKLVFRKALCNLLCIICSVIWKFELSLNYDKWLCFWGICVSSKAKKIVMNSDWNGSVSKFLGPPKSNLCHFYIRLTHLILYDIPSLRLSGATHSC